MFPHSSQRVLRIVVVAIVSLLANPAWSQTYKILYTFTFDSGGPESGLVLDSKGNAYGTTFGEHPESAGTIYAIAPVTGYHLLHSFAFDGRGYGPQGNLVLDAAGNIYGTTVSGGNSGEYCNPNTGDGTCGVVFELSPPSNPLGQWTYKVLYKFCALTNCEDGASPLSGVIFDSAGNLYGTTSSGGQSGSGTVFKLTRSRQGWTEAVLYNFCIQNLCTDGSQPFGGLIFDSVGNLYGTTKTGGSPNGGIVFELVPNGSNWTETVIYNFCTLSDCADGASPYAGMTFDKSGNLYGTTSEGGSACCGTVFELSPNSGGRWTETVLHSFAGGSDGSTPYAGVVRDHGGNIYGTTLRGGDDQDPSCQTEGCGTVFRLASGKDGQWNELLYRLPNYESGILPATPVLLDPVGNVYGTTTVGGLVNGTDGGGVVFQITP